MSSNFCYTFNKINCTFRSGYLVLLINWKHSLCVELVWSQQDSRELCDWAKVLSVQARAVHHLTVWCSVGTVVPYSWLNILLVTDGHAHFIQHSLLHIATVEGRTHREWCLLPRMTVTPCYRSVGCFSVRKIGCISISWQRWQCFFLMENDTFISKLY